MADSKLADLTAVTALGGDEVLYVVDDPAGTPLDRKVTVNNLLAAKVTAVGAYVAAQESTTSLTYVALTTAGPAVTVTTGTTAIVILSGNLQSSTAETSMLMGFDVSGATTLAASVANSFRVHNATANDQNLVSAALYITGLTAGSNTFTAKYRVTPANTGFFGERHLIVIPL